MPFLQSLSRPRFALFAIALWSISQLAQPAETAPPAAVTPAEPPAVEAPQADLTARSQEALVTLDALRSRVDAFGEPDDKRAQLEELRGRLEALLPEDQSLEELLDSPALVDGVMVRSRNLTAQAGALIDQLTQSAKQMEELLAKVTALETEWTAIRDESTKMPEALSGRVQGILAAAGSIKEDINARLGRLIELQDESMSVRNAITPIADRIDSYGKSMQTQLFQQNAARIWEITTSHISRSSERTTRVFAGNFRESFGSWARASESLIGSHLLLLPVILVLLYRLRKATDSPGAALSRPVPTGVLIWMLLGVAIYAGAPTGVKVIYVVVAMLVTAVVLVQAMPRGIRWGVLAFVALAILHEFIESLPILEHLPRVSYLVVALVLVVFGWLARHRESTRAVVAWGAPRSLIVGALGIYVVLLIVSVVANVLGYVALAKLLVVGVINSASVFLILFAGFSSVSEIIHVSLRLPALDTIRSIAANRYRLESVLRKPLVWISLALWIWVSLRSFGVSDWFFGSLGRMIQAEATVGTVTLSLGGVLLFGFAVWLAVWSSRMVRAVLNLDVFPRMTLPRGVPNTISMTVHYSIILLGLLVGVGSMGIDLSNLAFIIGALGVGIGFGLQNVVNNFVSGLILIFEAPIQIGDTVEVGPLMGRVTQIGIRTSRVRTFSGSEVIVPNGDLVSNQVINWTLSDRHRRLELKVGVAYGSDPEAVAEVIRAAVKGQPDVMEDPEPMVIFSGFGASSLDFRILAWISDYDQGLVMTHRLNGAINAALAAAGVTIPFPQQDVYVKSLPSRDGPGGE